MKELGANDYYFGHRPKSSVVDFSAAVRLVKLVIWGLRHNHSISSYIHDGHYDEQTEAFQITTRLLDKYHDDVLKRGSIPLIVLFPRQIDVVQHQEHGQRVYQPLIDYFNDKEYKFIDLLDAFERQESRYQELRDIFESDGMHYNSEGNHIARTYIYSYLDHNYFDNLPEQ